MRHSPPETVASLQAEVGTLTKLVDESISYRCQMRALSPIKSTGKSPSHCWKWRAAHFANDPPAVT
ncbi:hypothetical protein ACLK1T_23640 [Escherichia coli]